MISFEIFRKRQINHTFVFLKLMAGKRKLKKKYKINGIIVNSTDESLSSVYKLFQLGVQSACSSAAERDATARGRRARKLNPGR